MTDTQVREPEVPQDDERRMEDDLAGKVGLAALLLGTVALGIFGGWPILVVVLSLVFMIFMHELGHYLTAKSAGMKVTEFFIGFGPRVWSFHRGETEYGVKAIPAGAYVKIIGMNNLEEVDPADESRTYRQKSYPRRMSVAVAGSAMHFLMALVLAFVALVGYGVQDPSNWSVTTLSTPDEIRSDFRGVELGDDFEALLDEGQTPAMVAGLREGDRVVGADGESFDDFTDFQDFIVTHGGDHVTLVVERDGETFETETQFGLVTDGTYTNGFLGFAHDEERESLGIIGSARESLATVGGLMVDSVKAMGQFFTPSGLSNFADAVVNPESSDEEPEATLSDQGISQAPSSEDGRIISIVGAARLGAQATAADGLYALLNIMIVLNVFIGLFNLIPLLPFDGGHVAIGTYERIREIGRKGRYQADLTRMLPVAYAVVLFMVTIGAMALYADIADPINFPG
jgi:membrane-associated protease RseP (regulator of RpoE activity)